MAPRDDRGQMWLRDETAVAACVLWGSRLFSTADIAAVLKVPESVVSRTLAMARDVARMENGRPH